MKNGSSTEVIDSQQPSWFAIITLQNDICFLTKSRNI